MNKLKKVNAIQTTDNSNLIEKTDYNKKNYEIEKKNTDYARGKFNKEKGYC